MAPPLPLLTAVSRTARHASTWVFCAQHFGGCSLIYLAVFFLPLLLSELNPLWPPWLVACVVAAPLLLSVVTAVTGGAVTDAPGLSPSTPPPPRHPLGGRDPDLVRPPHHERRHPLHGPRVVIATQGLRSGRAPVLSRHAPGRLVVQRQLLGDRQRHAAAGLSAISIALINAVGNLGGFVGPYMVGRLKSPAHSKHVASWAPGILSVSIMVAPIMLCTSAYFCTRPVNKRRGASTSMAD